MRFANILSSVILLTVNAAQHQAPTISPALFSELEEFARIVDISYCVGITSWGIVKPFSCLSRCSDFPDFELVTTWDTGPFLSDSCGFLAFDHGKHRIIVAFRGTYSIANTVVDMATIPQKYEPYPCPDGDGDDDDDDVTDDNAQTVIGLREALWEGTIGRSFARRDPALSSPTAPCANCTVHLGFHRAWQHTRHEMLHDLRTAMASQPDYQLHLVGHSLGGAVAALAALEAQARGWHPIVTTFGEPRVGNDAFVRFLDARFGLLVPRTDDAPALSFRRVTHVNDPVPLLPLTEWCYAMHAGEIHITKDPLSPDVADVVRCTGDADPRCSAGQDASMSEAKSAAFASRGGGLLAWVWSEIEDVATEPWGIPPRYRLWELMSAHRDYFWRLGLCVPGGDPWGMGKGHTRAED